MLAGGVLTCQAVAVPTINKFGSLTNNNSYTPMSVSKTSLAKSISSVPVLETGIKSGNNTNIIGATSTFDNSGDATRFPGLGESFTKIVSPKISQKYTTPAGNTNNDAYEVAQRVINLEEKMLTKQEILEPGNGIDINGKTK